MIREAYMLKLGCALKKCQSYEVIDTNSVLSVEDNANKLLSDIIATHSNVQILSFNIEDKKYPDNFRYDSRNRYVIEIKYVYDDKPKEASS
jgi:hypothetical protein